MRTPLHRIAAVSLAALVVVSTSAHAQSAALKVSVAEQRPGPTAAASTLVTLESRTIIEIAPADLRDAALTTSKIEPTCIAAARATLASGRVVLIPNKDIAIEQRVGRPADCPAVPAETVRVAASGGGSRGTGGIPSTDAAMVQIRAQCEKEWATDFRMRNYCEEEQLKALQKLRQR